MAAEINLLDEAHHHREFMAGRIVFVERDRAGRILHLIGRAFAKGIHADAPKYLSLKEMAKPLYGYARLDKRPSEHPVILVESPPDAITARQWGFDALANIGTKMKAEHVALLQRLRRPLAIMPHNDGGIGLEAAERWREKIGQGKIILLPDEVKDLNELGTRADGETEFVFLMKTAGFERKPKRNSSERPARRFENEQLMAWASEGLLSSHF
jgi:DNA primase